MAQQRHGLLPAIQHADTVGAVQFVAGEYVEVAAQLLHVMPAMHHALGAIDHGECTLGLGVCQQRGQGLPGTKHVGQLADGEQSGTWADHLQGPVQVDKAVFIHRQHHQAQLPTLCQLLPGQQVGMVFQGADGDFVSGLEAVLQAIGE